MHSALQHFSENINRVKALGGLHEALCRLTTPAIDATDLLRAQIILVVSALDHYIHEITRLGMLEIYNGLRQKTNAFLRFQVTMEAAIIGSGRVGGTSWLETEIRERHGFVSFQRPDKIADAIRLFSDCDLWKSVATRLNLPKHDVKARLSVIVDRRNKIAHEADLDPSYPGTRWPISPTDVASAIDFIEGLCSAIHSTVV